MRMRKFLSYLLVFAMVFGFATNIGVMEAKAEDAEYTLYFKLPSDTSASDWCINVWSSVTVSDADTTNAFRPSTWGDGDSFPALKAFDSIWAYAKIKATAVEGLQFVKKDGTEYKCWNNQIIAGNHTSAYFNTTDSKWYKESDCTNEIIAPTLDKVFYIAGDEVLTGANWSPTSTKMQGENGTYTYTKSNLSVGTYKFKVLQDPEDFGWDYQWGTNAQGDNAADVGGDNASLTVTETSNVTITFTYADGKGKITTEIEPVQTENDDTNNDDTNNDDTTDSTVDNQVTVYVSLAEGVEWEKVFLYAWDGEKETLKEFFGAWPGAELSENKDNEGWYEKAIDITGTDGKINIIVHGGNGEQTENIVDRTAGTYWITINEDNTYSYVVVEPEGWVETTTEAEKDTSTGDNASDEGTSTATPTPAPVEVEEPTAKFHFKNSEKWEKVGIYFTTGDSWTEVTGKWPGSAMTLETGSTTWYEYDYYGIEKSFNYIFNNLVDGEGAVQTLNIEKAAPGEYWITLGEKDAEGKFAVNVATKAPADYDGKGIPGKTSANWTEAKSKIEEAAKTATDDKAATAEVDMKDSTKVPADVLAAMKDKNIDVSFKMGDLVWTINGKSIKDASKELNIGAVLNATAIDAKKVEKLASTIKCAKAIQLSLAHNGDFGAKLNLKSTLGKDYAGKFAVLYYYNPTADKFEYQQYVKIDAEGCATFAFDHASDYVIAITDDVVAKSVGAKTADTATTAGMVLMMLIASAGVVFVSKKRKMFA